MRIIVVHKDGVQIKDLGNNRYLAYIKDEPFPITRTALGKFKRMKTSVVKFLVDSEDRIIQTVSLDYTPLDNKKLATAITRLFGDSVKFQEYFVDDMLLWIRGYFKNIDLPLMNHLAFSFFNKNDSYHAFKAMFGIYTITCSNLAMFFEAVELIRLVHTWDEIKYQDPLQIVQNSVVRARNKIENILHNHPVKVYEKPDVEMFIKYLNYKRLLPNYAVHKFWDYLERIGAEKITNALVFEGLTYVTSNVLYLRKRFELINRLDAIAFSVLTKPNIVNDWAKVMRSVVGRVE